MKDLKTIPNFVMWHDGMVLCPQHLQQGFLRAEELCQYSISAVGAYNFGVRLLQFDTSLVYSGTIKLTELDIIFPDGTAYSYDQTLDDALEINLAKYKDSFEKEGNVLVHASIPRKMTKNSVLGATSTRFKSVKPEYSFDNMTGEDDVLIPRMRPNVQLHVGKETTSDVILLPLLLVNFENEAFKIAIYTPPILKVSRQWPAWELCVATSTYIRQKTQTLIEDVNKLKLISYSEYIFDRYFVLRSLKDCVLKFEVAVRSEQMHPFNLFLEFVDIFSKISSTDLDQTQPAPPIYEHTNIQDSFQKVKNFITDFLEREIPSNYSILRVNKVDNRYEIPLSEKFIFNSNYVLIGLKKPAQISNSDFSAWIKTSIITNNILFKSILEKRVLGYTREIIDHFNDLIPQRNIFLVYVTLDKNQSKLGNLILSASVGSRFDFSPDDVFLYGKKN